MKGGPNVLFAAALLLGAACEPGYITDPEPDSGRRRPDASVVVDAGQPSNPDSHAKDAGADAGGDTPSGQPDAGNSGPTDAGGWNAIQTCPAVPGAPPGTAPLPTRQQLAYQHLELTAFIHLGMATFDGTEQGDLSKDVPSLFNPTNLNASTVTDWVNQLKAAGFRQATLTAKHSTGFCLWPSQYTDYSVKSSSWMNGQGDVVRLFVDAMHAANMRVGLYLAPWDQKYPSSSPNYETYFKNQVTELLTNYGPVYEIWLDGANSSTAKVNWKSIFELAKTLQPDVLVWAGPELANTGAIPDLQWIGNENGRASRTTSSLETNLCGGQHTWCAFETNVSARVPNWFWHPNQTPMSLASMQSSYFTSVGLNSTLLFNVPPSAAGPFDAADATLLQKFGAWYSGLYKTNLLKAQSATADSTWASPGFETAKLVDDDPCTYWAAASGQTSARLEVTPASPIVAKVISIREAIELGERVKQYHVELKQNGSWVKAPTDSSGAKIQGTVIGQRQLWQLNSSNVEAVALVIDSAKDAPAIAELSVY